MEATDDELLEPEALAALDQIGPPEPEPVTQVGRPLEDLEEASWRT